MSEKKLSWFDRIGAKLPSDEQSKLQVEMLNFITILYLVVYTIAVIGAAVTGSTEPVPLIVSMFNKGGSIVLMMLIAQVIARSGYVRAGSIFLVVVLWLNSFYQSLISGGVSSPEYAAYMAVVVVAGLFLGLRAAMITGAGALLAGLALFVLNTTGRLPTPVVASPVVGLLAGLMRIIIVSGLLYLFLRRLEQALFKLQQVNSELAMNSQMLEGRVSERTRALKLSAEISREISTILDQDHLVRAVVEELKAAFDYYHVQIYLLDAAGEYLVLQAGTGESGRVMLDRGHKIQVENGLVGRAVKMKTSVLVNNTFQDRDWLQNPMLPETRSELAVPFGSGGKIMGVLDVQQNRVDGLTQEDVQMLETVANQVSIAIENAAVYHKAQQQADREALISSISQSIQKTSSIDEALQVAVGELGRALGAQRSSVELRSSEALVDRKTSSN